VLTNLTLRTKALIGVALACAGYIVLMPDNSQTIEPTHNATTAPAPHVIRPAAGVRKSPVMNAAFRSSDRIVGDTIYLYTF